MSAQKMLAGAGATRVVFLFYDVLLQQLPLYLSPCAGVLQDQGYLKCLEIGTLNGDLFAVQYLQHRRIHHWMKMIVKKRLRSVKRGLQQVMEWVEQQLAWMVVGFEVYTVVTGLVS